MAKVSFVLVKVDGNEAIYVVRFWLPMKYWQMTKVGSEVVLAKGNIAKVADYMGTIEQAEAIVVTYEIEH